MSNIVKTCKSCAQEKNLETDFYICQGSARSDCKACTIKKNVAYQKQRKAWMHRFVDSEQQKSYMVDYYARNKEKFAEYRRKFRERYPGYHKEYARKRKDELK